MSSDLAQSLAFAGINESTRVILRETWPMVRDSVPVILQAAYAPTAGRPAETAKLDAARNAQAKHWEALFKCEFDDLYVASLQQIGKTHAQIGLDPQFLVAAHLTALTRLHSLVVQAHYTDQFSFGARSRLDRAIRAVDQVALLDLQLCMSAYVDEVRASVAPLPRQEAWRFANDRGDDLSQVVGEQRRAADTLFTNGQRRRSRPELEQVAEDMVAEVAAL